MSTNEMTRAWMEVRSDALRRNLARIRDSVGPGVGLVPMVKADAYGTGVHGAVSALSTESPWGFGVAAVEEGIQLRRMGVDGPVVVFSPTPPGSVPAALEAGLTLTVSSTGTLDLLEAAGADAGAAFHLEVDTGMGRAGFDWRQVAEWGPGPGRPTMQGSDGPDVIPTSTPPMRIGRQWTSNGLASRRRWPPPPSPTKGSWSTR